MTHDYFISVALPRVASGALLRMGLVGRLVGFLAACLTRGLSGVREDICARGPITQFWITLAMLVPVQIGGRDRIRATTDRERATVLYGLRLYGFMTLIRARDYLVLNRARFCLSLRIDLLPKFLAMSFFLIFILIAGADTA